MQVIPDEKFKIRVLFPRPFFAINAKKCAWAKGLQKCNYRLANQGFQLAFWNSRCTTCCWFANSQLLQIGILFSSGDIFSPSSALPSNWNFKNRFNRELNSISLRDWKFVGTLRIQLDYSSSSESFECYPNYARHSRPFSAAILQKCNEWLANWQNATRKGLILELVTER